MDLNAANDMLPTVLAVLCALGLFKAAGAIAERALRRFRLDVLRSPSKVDDMLIPVIDTLQVFAHKLQTDGISPSDVQHGLKALEELQRKAKQLVPPARLKR